MNVTTEVSGLAAVQGARTESTSSPSVARDQNNAGSSDQAASSLALSAAVAQVDQIHELARSEPDVRPDVVAQARADMAAGTLTADPSELAAMISRDIF